MFSFFSSLQKQSGSKDKLTRVKFTISGMHCVSCALTIDDALEELPGVRQAKTSYAKGTTLVEFYVNKVSLATLSQTIQTQGYQVKSSSLDT
jgi:Cu+-exporting ATPase